MTERSQPQSSGARSDDQIDPLTLVVPCFNEADRLQLRSFTAALEQLPWLSVIFVNDGSSDRTGAMLDEYTIRTPRTRALHLSVNSGKAEAVRQGLLLAVDESPTCGFWDADLSAPLTEVVSLKHALSRRPTLEWAWGIRLRSMGRVIERSELRHYLGRAFATVATALVGVRAYDTQCGSKLFRSSEILRRVLSEPFHSRWIFDVEMLVRLAAINGGRLDDLVHELPLGEWRHVGGSKVKPADFFKAIYELLQIRRTYGVVSD